MIADPIHDRANLAHDAPEQPATLAQRAGTLIEQAAATAAARVQTGVQTVNAEVKRAADAITRLSTGQETAADVALASNVLHVVANATDAAINAARRGKDVGEVLRGQIPQLVHALMPGISVKDVTKALAVAQALVSLSRHPTIPAAAKIFEMLRGNPRRGQRDTGNLGDFLLGRVLSMAQGQPFDPSRFLSGALRATGKDFKARALILRDEERARRSPA